MRRELDLEHYTEDEEYKYLGLPPKPYWFKNLEKAWEANKNVKGSKNKFDQLLHDIGIPKGIKYHTDIYVQWTLQQDYPVRSKVGRPKLPPELLKKPKIKRSVQMRQLLKENCIEVLSDSTLEGYPNLKFLPNGRVGGKGLNISVHQFLQNLNGK